VVAAVEATLVEMELLEQIHLVEAQGVQAAAA
jgi:hypothetical protein